MLSIDVNKLDTHLGVVHVQFTHNENEKFVLVHICSAGCLINAVIIIQPFCIKCLQIIYTIYNSKNHIEIRCVV